VRMWLVRPIIMCRKHLLGEHVELHMLCGYLARGKSITGWINNNCLEPESIMTRHAELVSEMVRRCYKHHSPIPEPDLSYLPYEQREHLIDTGLALEDLLSRCSECRERFNKFGG
jgi:hypothetical protein